MRTHIRHLSIAVAGAFFVSVGLALAASNVGVHTSNIVTLSQTPQAIGSYSGREELAVQVSSGAANGACCTWNAPNANCATPGQGGFLYGASSGRVICKYASIPFYCSGVGGASEISYDEVAVKTATNTATPTVTPTPA